MDKIGCIIIFIHDNEKESDREDNWVKTRNCKLTQKSSAPKFKSRLTMFSIAIVGLSLVVS